MPKKEPKMIEVVATRPGHFETYRKAGARFIVPEDMVSKRWMVPADSAKAAQFSKALENKNVDRDQITGERLASGGLSEQLSVALTENNELKAEVADLKAQVESLTTQLGRATGGGNSGGLPAASPDEPVKTGETEAAAPAARTATTTRRRRSTSK